MISSSDHAKHSSDVQSQRRYEDPLQTRRKVLSSLSYGMKWTTVLCFKTKVSVWDVVFISLQKLCWMSYLERALCFWVFSCSLKPGEHCTVSVLLHICLLLIKSSASERFFWQWWMILMRNKNQSVHVLISSRKWQKRRRPLFLFIFSCMSCFLGGIVRYRFHFPSRHTAD